MNNSNERISNIELLRIILMLMVIGLHYNLVGMGNAFYYTNEVGVNVSLSHLLESFCIGAVDVFVIIAGYFMIKKKKIHKEKIYKELLLIIVLNIMQYIINIIVNSENFSIKAFILEMISGKWFIIVYLALYILSPYINKFLNTLSKEQYKKFMIILILLFVVYQSIVNFISVFIPVIGWSPIIDKGIDSGYTIVNFFVLYVIGGYLNLYGKKGNSMEYMIKYVLASLLIFINWYILNNAFHVNNSGIAFYYNNIIVLLSSVYLFMFFKSIDIGIIKIINSISKTTLSVFILSTSRCFINIYNIMNVKKYSITKFYIPHFILTSIVIFFICSFTGYFGIKFVDFIFKMYNRRKRGKNIENVNF